MKILSVRFGAEQQRLIEREAKVEGVSTSAFIRDAAYARAILQAARREDRTLALFESLIAAVEENGQDAISGMLRDAIEGRDDY
jgi:uncharacterized protein (DUF1778 family)